MRVRPDDQAGSRDPDREHLRLIDSPPQSQNIETGTELGRTSMRTYTLFPNWVSPLSNYFVPPLILWPNDPRIALMDRKEAVAAE